MAEGERQYWVRTEQGNVWGPYSRPVLERLRGRLNDRCTVSLDGRQYLPGSDFPELAELLAAAEARPPPTRAPVEGSLRASSRLSASAAAAPVAAAPEEAEAAPEEPPADDLEPPAPAAAPEPPPPVVPEEGNLATVSAVRLYAIAAATNATGWLQIHSPSGSLIQISFRRGTPEQVSSDDPELGLLRFLLDKKVITPAQAVRAEEHREKGGLDALSALFQLQLIPPADAHRLLGEHGLFVLDRALSTWLGTSNFEADAPSPPGAYPLGAKWALLSESNRRLDAAVVRARLGRKLQRRVQRSGGNAVGRLEELALNAQEARLYASIDGTKTGDELLTSLPDPSTALRLLHLLVELGHLAFDEQEPAAPRPPPIQEAPPVAAAKTAPPAARPTASAPAPQRTVGAPPGTSRPLVTPSGGTPRLSVAARVPPAPVTRPLPTIARQVPSVPPRPTGAAAVGAPASAPPRPAASAPPGGTPVAPAASKAPPRVTSPTRASPPVAVVAAPPAAAVPLTGDAALQLAHLRATFEALEKADHFEVLGLKRGKVSPGESRKAFFQLAREYHPDTVIEGAPPELRAIKERLFARINEASEILGDDARRKEYEAELDGEAKNVDVGNIFAAEDAFQKAELLIKARKYPEGLEAIDEAIKLHADEGEFYAWRGWCRFMLAKDRRAAHADCLAEVKKALKLNERCVPAHMFMGQMAKILGDLKAAEAAFKRALDHEPKNLEATRELRYLWPGKKG